MGHAMDPPFDGVGVESRGRAGDQITEGQALARLDKAD